MVIKANEFNYTQPVEQKDDWKMKEIKMLKEHLWIALKTKDQAIEYNAFLENKLREAYREIEYLNQEINELTKREQDE